MIFKMSQKIHRVNFFYSYLIFIFNHNSNNRMSNCRNNIYLLKVRISIFINITISLKCNT